MAFSPKNIAAPELILFIFFLKGKFFQDFLPFFIFIKRRRGDGGETKISLLQRSGFIALCSYQALYSSSFRGFPLHPSKFPPLAAPLLLHPPYCHPFLLLLSSSSPESNISPPRLSLVSLTTCLSQHLYSSLMLYFTALGKLFCRHLMLLIFRTLITTGFVVSGGGRGMRSNCIASEINLGKKKRRPKK